MKVKPLIEHLPDNTLSLNFHPGQLIGKAIERAINLGGIEYVDRTV